MLLFVGISAGIAGLLGLYVSVTSPAPAVGGTYREGLLKEPRTINPIFAAQDGERDLARIIYSGLLTYGGAGNIIPDLAERYEISKDGKNYTLTLRDAFWHDGEKITADDVVFTIKTIQNPLYKSVLRANWQGVEVEASDPKTVRFSLRTPYVPFIENLTVGILPKHLWAGIGPDQAILHELNLKPVGSGPYRFDKLSQAKDGTLLWYQLARNSSYYREGPYIKKITFYFYKTEEELIHALRKGSIDGYGPASSRSLAELNINKKTVYPIFTPRVFGLFFNQKKDEALADKQVRLAIMYAIDKKNITDNAGASGALVAYGPLPFLFADTPALRYDPEYAKKILEDAGWKTGNNGVREKTVASKKKLTTTSLRFMLATSDWPDLVRAAEIIKDELIRVGIEVKIEKRPVADLESNVIRPRNFDMLLFGELYGFEADPFAFWHSSQIKDPGLNITQYTNQTIDRILEEARRAVDTETREKKYIEFSAALMKDIPAIFLYTQLYHYILPSTLNGVSLKKISLPADRFNTINVWHLKTRRTF